MSATLTIRDIIPDDRPGWEDLWIGYLDFYGVALDPVVTEVTWSRLIDPHERMFATVAERNGELVGLVHCILHRGTWTIGELCYLEDLYVTEEARGHGVGRALIEAVYARADAAGCARVYWLTHESNLTARRLYDKVASHRGFIQYRRD